MPPPSVWEGHTCKVCGHHKVVSRGYCMRCYKQVQRGREPKAKPPVPPDRLTRLVIMVPSGLLKRIRKAAGGRRVGLWMAEACERRLAAGPEVAPPLTSDVPRLKKYKKAAEQEQKPAEQPTKPAVLPNGARTLASYRQANGRMGT